MEKSANQNWIFTLKIWIYLISKTIKNSQYKNYYTFLQEAFLQITLTKTINIQPSINLFKNSKKRMEKGWVISTNSQSRYFRDSSISPVVDWGHQSLVWNTIFIKPLVNYQHIIDFNYKKERIKYEDQMIKEYDRYL